MARDYFYEYGFEFFDDVDRAFEVATGFHETLRGEVDYVDSNVMVSFEGPKVTVSVYPEARIEITIEDDGNGPYISYRS